MIQFSNCKINIGLNVTKKRTDGYHNLTSVFYPVSWNDVLEIEDAKKFELVEYQGNRICAVEENLVYKAYKLLCDAYDLPPVKLHLLKNIPNGAGLGGGSANGANTLILINSFFKLNISQYELQQYALQLGSDCPFFVNNKPALVKGRGEIIKSVSLNLDNYYILILHPGVHISTATAFKHIHPLDREINYEEILNQDITKWGKYFTNDFEEYAFSVAPEIKIIKNKLFENGALFASMSGSGSSVYGIFESYQDAIKAQSSFSHYKSFLHLSIKHMLNFI